MKLPALLPSADWLNTEDAAERLCIDRRTLLKVGGDQTVRHIGDRDGYLWWKRDVQQLAGIRKRFKVSLNVALRIMAAERPGNA